MKKIFYGGLSIILLLLIWQLSSFSLDNQYILPGPVQVFSSFFQLLLETSTYSIILLTLLRLSVALITSSILAIILGIIAGNYQNFDYFLKPIVSSLRTLPVASVIIIIIILIGNDFSLYLITFLMIFPLVYEAAKDGIINISNDLKDSIALEGHHPLVIMTKVQLPLALPFIKTAIFQSLGLGFKVIVMAEFIIQSTKGIGNELYKGSISINYHLVFAWTLIIILIVMIMEFLIKKLKKLM
jgi:NitT/TauT family transport system permease protein